MKSISVGMNMALCGYLLGYQVLQDGVVVEDVKYHKPVKNLVVNTGKDFLLKTSNSLSSVNTCVFSGMVSQPRFGYYTATHSGVLAYCGRGSGSTATTATDTTLQTQIGNKTNTFLIGDPNTGTAFDREAGKVIMRATHDHEAESSDQNINEVAWFGIQNSVSIMFSRVVLPSTVTVLTGQQLRTVYQLEVTISPISSTPASPTITGWTTDGDVRFECNFPATSTTLVSPAYNTFALFDALTTTGASPASSSSATTDGGGLCGCSQSASNNGAVTMYGTAQTFNTFGTVVANPTAGATVWQAFAPSVSSGVATSTTANYVNGNFYRDCTYVFEGNWTGNASINIYAIRIRGFMFILDNPQTKSNTQRLTLVYRVSVT